MSAARPRASNRGARSYRHDGARIGLALAAGGPLGGTYEVGTLLALADSLEGVELNALDAYVGVSSGAFVAAALANDISPAQMYRLFIEEGRDAALKPAIFLKPALREFARRFAALPGLGLRGAIAWLRDPLHRGVMESLAILAGAVPTGLFDNRAIDAFFARLFSAPGKTNDFRKLGHRLFVVATNLDSGCPVAFGASGRDHVPISRAIAASAAFPGLFPPVEIDGAHYVDGALNKSLHASLALDEGVDLLLCISPLVPFDVESAHRRGHLSVAKLHRGGLPRVLSQTFRAIIHSRMKVGMEKYATRYPNADIVLFEPAREDIDMFHARIFSYARRRRLCALAFDSTRASLRARAAELSPLLARHGVRLNSARLADDRRRVTDAVCDPRPLHAAPERRRDLRSIRRDLEHALTQLEREVECLRPALAL